MKINFYTFIFFAASSLFFSCGPLASVKKTELNATTSEEKNLLQSSSDILIFHDYMDKFSWVSPEPNCLTVSKEINNKADGSASVHIQWDKITNGCKWLGIGFGSGNWPSRDFMERSKNMALQMKVKSVKGSFKNLPVAFAFEDNFGVQCYYGFRMEQASGAFNDSSWTTVSIPLSKFDFKAQQFNIERITQFIIQLEADGDIYLDEVKFISLKND